MAERTVESVARELDHAAGEVLAARPPHAEKLFAHLARHVLRCERRAAREALEAAASMFDSHPQQYSNASAVLRRLAAQEGSDADEG